jgi:hypothetical protein
MPLRFHRSQVSERSFGIARIVHCQSSAVYFLVFLLFPFGLSVTRRRIGKTLSDDSLDRPFGALHVVNTEPDVIAVPEIILGKISVQMLLAAMLVDAFHAALEDRIIAFNGVGVNLAANVFFTAITASSSTS